MRDLRLPDGAHRWLWFVALYVAAVAVVGAVAYGLRAMLNVFK